MSPQVETVIAEFNKLPPKDQEEFTAWILAEWQAEQRWQASFAASADILAQLAEKALSEFEAGETELLDPETLK